jgi:two-component system sensor histidine kinase DesK
MALSAAGIEADVEETHVRVDPAVEAVLAWTVREGATNVIRHSRASHCTFRVSASLTDAGVEVIDDGRGVVINGRGAGEVGIPGDVVAPNGDGGAFRAARQSGPAPAMPAVHA